MISLFRKHFASRSAVRLAFSTGVLACASFVTAGAFAQAPTRVQLSSEQEQGVLSLTARVADVGGAAVSEGSVSFETSHGSLGSVFVHNGTATLYLTDPPAWAKTVTAVYHGDTAFANSAVSTAVSTEASGLPGFTVTASPSSLSLKAGQYGSVNLTVTSQNGFSEAVNLSCSGLSGGSRCTFNPVVLTPPANGSGLSTMQITTTANSGGKTQGALSPLQRSGAVYALVIPGLLALAGFGAARRKHFGALRMVGLLMLLGAGAMGLTACNERYGYEHYPPSPNLGTAPGSYTVVISAYSSNGTAITNATSSDPNCAGAVCVALTVQ